MKYRRNYIMVDLVTGDTYGEPITGRKATEKLVYGREVSIAIICED